MKIRRRLNESLIQDGFVVTVPLIIKFRTDSNDEESIIRDLKPLIMNDVVDELDHRYNKELSPYLKENKQVMEDALKVGLDIYSINVNAESYNNIPMMDGYLFFDVYIDYGQTSIGEVKRVFNTMLNNNVINKEITFTLEHEEYGEFDVIVESIKNGNVIIEEV